MILQETIRGIHQRLRALETREYTEVGTPTACFEQYIEHCDDPDTFINFQPDNFQVDVGGKTALYLDDTWSNVLLGADAGAALTLGDSNTLLGFEAGTSSTEGVENVFIGYQSGYTCIDEERNVSIGTYSMGLATASYNVAIGYQALEDAGTTNQGDMNVAIGYRAMMQQDTGEFNVAIGADAMLSFVSGDGNVAIGEEAMRSVAGSGEYNIAIGYDSMRVITSGHSNVAVGSFALISITTGNYNIAIGREAMSYNATSHNNVVIGYRAGYKGAATTYDNCVLLGYQAGYLLQTGDANVFLGYQAGYNETGANKLYIENSDSVTPLIYGEFDNNLVRVHGTLGVGTAGDYLDISLTGVVTLLGTAKRDLTLRADLDYTTITAQGKPTQTIIGVFHGYSMPIYNNDNEELFFNENVPGRWDGASDISFHVLVALELAETADETFKFQFSWNQVGTTDIVPIVSHDVTDEITVIDGTQYATYMLEFTIDYDADAGDVIVSHDDLSARLRRVASGGDEVDGEIIVLDWHTHYTVDKMFKAPE